ncbi:hypothetical protein GCM10022251_82160 [Phytohabitans flavus]|uniref:Radical SAM core domain-containing protein n=1 Tax=Phytohabitans flavus TaxID=1076124 RepID=A0A6F8Y8Z2_9ACTN|nr:hypothetical protein Pflav_089920 [Phytohabitans flavus]
MPRFTVTLHGGEPLMAGAELIEYTVTTIAAAVPPETRVDFTIQTNGILLTADLLELFDRLGLRVGVSLDGGRVANDRHRRFSNGGGSYDKVREALTLIRQERFAHLFSGLLCVVDLRNDPLDVYRDLVAFAPPRIDFLLPHGNWTTPPPGKEPASPSTPYADWLIPIFDLWYAEPQTVDIRLFSSIMALLVGEPSRTEAVGLKRSAALVVETDGSIEQVDSLKTTAPDMAATGFDIDTHTFDQALAHPAIEAQYRGLSGLAPGCQRCPIVSVCGGGMYAHRYRDGDFLNPTVFCADQLKLIQHIRRRLFADLEALRGSTATTAG